MSVTVPLAHAVRALAFDAVEQAQSGHPGMPMGMADIAQVLWLQFLKFDPAHPEWINRDRFVLSNGHGAMLLYAVLHLTGYEVSIDDLRSFRQWRSKTPGHPEIGDTPGVETTTGPLGQGFANAVGMALAQKMMAAEFNREGFDIIDHDTFVFMGDGCHMEGVSHEAAALAATWQLGRLIAIYDDNNISIDGPVAPWMSEDVAARFRSYGWYVIEKVDGHDPKAIAAAIQEAQQCQDRPTLICAQTHIGFGSPNKVDSASSHGAPLGVQEIAATRAQLNWPHAPFEIPQAIKEAWDCRRQGRVHYEAWQADFARYQKAHPELAAQLLHRKSGQLSPLGDDVIDRLIETLSAQPARATRQSSKAVLDTLVPLLPEIIGGSADLSGSNGTQWQGHVPFSAKQPLGRYIHYGVREFGMSAVMNGLALYGGFKPYAGTFLVFGDYARNAVRLSALMRQSVIYVFTHDSIGLGEDGPTHQPVEHLTMLRATPNLQVWRPCDAVETVVAWQQALNYQGPSVLVLSRQTLPHQSRTQAVVAQIAKGGYVLYDCAGVPEGMIVATGSEVMLAVAAALELARQGVAIRVISMPCMETFRAQPKAYKDQVLPPNVTARLAVEAGSKVPWYEWVGLQGAVIGMDTFGASAPAEILFKQFGFTTPHLVTVMDQLVKDSRVKEGEKI